MLERQGTRYVTPIGPSVTSPRPLVVGIGEVLFDCFPDREVLGGAPINVAIHADALLGKHGGAGVPVTRVGADARGEQVLYEASARGLDTRYVQFDRTLPTGRVEVSLDPDGHAEYVFDPNGAWDALAYDAPLAALAGRCDAVAFGTLGQRTLASRETIRQFLGHAPQALRLFDVNLRQAFFNAEVIDSSLRLASAAKLNEEEVDVVSRLLDLDAVGAADERPHMLAAAYGLDWLVVTRGAMGVTLYADGECHNEAPAAFDPLPGADSVGAGDACCAGLLCGFLHGLPIQKTLGLANRLGAYVAERPGATPALPDSLLGLISGAPSVAAPE